jgi:hypothetical protein
MLKMYRLKVLKIYQTKEVINNLTIKIRSKSIFVLFIITEDCINFQTNNKVSFETCLDLLRAKNPTGLSYRK